MQHRKRGPARRRLPDHVGVRYGPHPRHLLDAWLPRRDLPTPALIAIHGGGFRGGDRSVNRLLLRSCLRAGIAVITITYRFSKDALAPAQFHDGARAVQYLRSRAAEWNIAPDLIAASGESGGGGISLWLAFHADLADAASQDPVARQSTRIRGAMSLDGQTTYDPRVVRELFPGTDTWRHPALAAMFGLDFDHIEDMPDETRTRIEETSPITHLGPGAAPVLLMHRSEANAPVVDREMGMHHPRFGAMLKQRMDEVGVRCEIETGVVPGSECYLALAMEFLERCLR